MHVTQSAEEFFSASARADGSWKFGLGQDKNGAFGGTFGGFLAAASIFISRNLAGNKVPLSVDIRFLRSLSDDVALLIPTVLHEGRSLTSTNVDVFDRAGRLTTRALTSFVTAHSLTDRDHPGPERGASGHRPWDEGRPWRHPPHTIVPIIDTFLPRAIGRDDRGDGVAIPIPWSDGHNGAEAIALAADISVGSPVAGAFADDPAPSPNPDLSVRFLSDTAPKEVAAFARLERIAHGIAAVSIEIWSDRSLIGIGLCSSLLIGAKRHTQDTTLPTRTDI